MRTTRTSRQRLSLNLKAGRRAPRTSKVVDKATRSKRHRSEPPLFPPPPPPAKQRLQPRQVSGSAAGGEEDPEDYKDLKATAVVESEDEAKGPDDLVDMLSFDSQSKVVDKATRSKHHSLLRPPMKIKTCTNMSKEEMHHMVIALSELCLEIKADQILSSATLVWRLVACYLVSATTMIQAGVAEGKAYSKETGVLVRTLMKCVKALMETKLWKNKPENDHVRTTLEIWWIAMSCGNPVKQVQVAAGTDTEYIMLELRKHMQQEHQALL